jgi:hypothetical protein
MLAKSRNYGLPEPWMVIVSAVTVTPLPVEKLSAKPAGDSPVIIGLVTGAGFHIALGARVVRQQVYFSSQGSHFRLLLPNARACARHSGPADEILCGLR